MSQRLSHNSVHVTKTVVKVLLHSLLGDGLSDMTNPGVLPFPGQHALRLERSVCPLSEDVRQGPHEAVAVLYSEAQRGSEQEDVPVPACDLCPDLATLQAVHDLLRGVASWDSLGLVVHNFYGQQQTGASDVTNAIKSIMTCERDSYLRSLEQNKFQCNHFMID